MAATPPRPVGGGQQHGVQGVLGVGGEPVPAAVGVLQRVVDARRVDLGHGVLDDPAVAAWASSDRAWTIAAPSSAENDDAVPTTGTSASSTRASAARWAPSGASQHASPRRSTASAGATASSTKVTL